MFELIPYRRDKKALKAYLESHPVYQALDLETAEAAGELIGLTNFIKEKEKYEEGGVYNMCTAIRELIEDSKAEGREEGREEGCEEGREAGREEAIRLLIGYQKQRMPRQEVLLQVMGIYSLDQEQASVYMEKYWDPAMTP